MDAAFVLSSCNWILAELVRVFHNLSTVEAQSIVDRIIEFRTPLVWNGGDDIRRVLNNKFSLREQILVLLASSTGGRASVVELIKWTEAKNKNHFLKIIKTLHSERNAEFNTDKGYVELLPPGVAAATVLLTGRS